MTAFDLDVLRKGVLSADRRMLANAITLIESRRPEDRNNAEALLHAVIRPDPSSIRVGVTGIPGVGKSTFIEALGNHLVVQGSKVAVLPIDPSSPVSGGSLLGDKP